jgi:hypothetical protein
MKKAALILFTLSLNIFSLLGTAAEAQTFTSRQHEFVQIAEFNIPEANQGIAVDGNYFYAIDNYAIAKYDKKTGELVQKWQGPKVTFNKLSTGEQHLESGGPIIHLDGGIIHNGLLYCAHSNYPIWPMTSSIEVWNPVSMEHISTYSFGIQYGSLTWIDYHNGYWWGLFANYNKKYGENGSLYGNKRNTTLVRMNDQWQILEGWVLPDKLLDKFEDMSCSGGSWGQDGYLYLAGHDPAEIYRCRLPDAGSIVELLEAIPANIRGQGIAWDRSQPDIIYGIIRATDAEKAKGITHKVTVHKLNELPK